jgi:hypothetical protein
MTAAPSVPLRSIQPRSLCSIDALTARNEHRLGGMGST